jgi:membrane peptidoglycan carboxypeptidase
MTRIENSSFGRRNIAGYSGRYEGCSRRAKERLAYVLGRMKEDGVISADDKDRALAAPAKLLAFEDRRFFQHHGVDERGIIRAFIGNLAEPGRPQGGSTITQQVVKNLLVGDDVSYERRRR